MFEDVNKKINFPPECPVIKTEPQLPYPKDINMT